MESEKKLIKEKDGFNKALHAWYHEFQRKLPWREEPSVYKTVVSEFMLQQTQVDTVLPYFDRWVKRFPGFKELAKASEKLVVKHWEGLGYYSRARNLHKLAKAVVELDELPRTAVEWLPFSGVGPYTAAAIASIGFGDKATVVDGNVIRVYSRLTANGTEFKNNGAARNALRGVAEAMLHDGDPNSHNQAVMELGATVCYRTKPLCTVCPIVAFCEGAKLGNPERYPKLTPKKIEQVVVKRVWVDYKHRLLLHKIPADAKRLANMCELPRAEGLVKGLKNEDLWVTKRREISNQRIEEKIYKIEKGKLDLKDNKEMQWVDIDKLGEVTLSGPHRKWIEGLLGR